MLYKRVKDKKQLDVIKKAGLPIDKQPIYLDFLVASTILKSIKKGSLDDLLKLAQLLGEQAEAVSDGKNEQALQLLAEAIKGHADK